MDLLEKSKKLAQEIQREKFKDCDAFLLAGSIVRGEGSSTSDLDIVVYYQNLENAYRDSFLYKGMPVEVFVHDQDTFRYFYDVVERQSGFCSLSQMTLEGITIHGKSEVVEEIKALAKSFQDKGPEVWTKAQIDRARYLLTDICDDLKGAKNKIEMQAILIKLYENLANFYFRAQNLWSANGKMIPRKLKIHNESLFQNFTQAFDQAFSLEKTDAVSDLVQDILKPYGGKLFEGYKLDAPKEWRQSE